MKRPPRRPAKDAVARADVMKHAVTAVMNGYHGASASRPALSGWTPRGSDANGDLVRDLPALRVRSRDLSRNAPLATGAINTLCTNVVGTGLSLQCFPDRDALGMSDDDAQVWADQTEREFRLWADSVYCDAALTQNFFGLQDLVFRAACESGDVAALLPMIARPHARYRTAVQVVEADRLCNPQRAADTASLTAGVEMDAWGAPIAYHIANRHPGAVIDQRALEWRRVPAWGGSSGRRNIIHLYERRRPGQVRGVPMLAPVIEPLKQLQRYTDAELQAAVIAGMFAVFVKMDADAFSSLLDDDGKSTYLHSAMQWDGSLAGDSGPGKAVNLLPGEDIESANPGRPNALFDPFIQAIVRQIGAALEMPFEVLIKHFTASYSASRAALLDAWRFFRKRRDWLATYFCQPVYETWLEEAVSAGRIKAPGFFADIAIRRAWCGAAWVGDGPGSIDPEKEINAAQKRIDAGISTLAAESILHDGGDWRTKNQQRTREVAARKAGGLAPEATPASAANPPPEPSPAKGNGGANASPVVIHNHLPAPSPTPVTVNVEPTPINLEAALPAAPAPTVQINVEPTPITVEAVMPAADAPAVQIHVEPTPVKVESAPARLVLQRPARARQTVEHDPQTQEIVATLTTYEYEEPEEE